MNEVMWREVMGFRNTPEQRCLLQGALNPRHAGFPLWVPGASRVSLCGEPVGGFSSGGEAVETGVSLMTLDEQPAHEKASAAPEGLGIPVATGSMCPGCWGRGAGGALLVSPAEADGERFDYLGEMEIRVTGRPWGTSPQRFPGTSCSQGLAVCLPADQNAVALL